MFVAQMEALPDKERDRIFVARFTEEGSLELHVPLNRI
jgi:hypothetical protein